MDLATADRVSWGSFFFIQLDLTIKDIKILIVFEAVKRGFADFKRP